MLFPRIWSVLGLGGGRLMREDCAVPVRFPEQRGKREGANVGAKSVQRAQGAKSFTHERAM